MKYPDALTKYFRNSGFYHFTDTRNIAGIIAAEGILSRREATRLSHNIIVVGENDWSVEADDRAGMDGYVHLCFTKFHPMEYLAIKEGRIQESKYLRVSADVLDIPGTLCTLDVSNKAGVQGMPIDAACGHIDFQVLYERTDWKDQQVQGRLQQARKYEILVPTKVPLALLSGY